jgi:hypothetical protein
MTRARDLANYTNVQSQITAKATAGENGVPFRMAVGYINNTPGGGQSTITLPANRFTIAPRINATVISADVSSVGTWWAASTTSFILRTWNTTNNTSLPREVVWTAIQMTAGSTDG